MLKAEIFFRIPNDYLTCSRASTEGVPIAVNAPQSKIAASYRQLASRLSGRTEQEGRSSTNGSRMKLRTMFTRKRS